MGETRFYIYNKAGKVLTARDGAGETNYEYDGMYRVAKETRADNGQDGYAVSSSYNHAGDRTGVSNPGKSVTYAYDVAGRLLRVVEGSKTTSYTYDKNSNKLSETKPNGMLQGWSYDALNRNTAQTAKDTAGATLYRAGYTFNLVGKRLSIIENLVRPDATISQRTMTYGYDSLYQMTSEDISVTDGANLRRDYSYDSRGNRLTLAHTAGGTQTTTTYSYNAADQLLTETKGGAATTYEYDADGNRSKKIAPDKTAVYNWDTAGRLSAVDTDNDGVNDFIANYDYRMSRVRLCQEKRRDSNL